MVLGVRHFESLTLWIQLRPGLRDRAWKVTNGHSRKLTKLSMTIFSKFWSRDRYHICIHGSRPRCFTCIAEQVASEIDDMFLGAGGPWHVISRTQAQKWPNLSVQLEDIISSTVDPGRVISNHRDSSRVGSCQLSSLLGGFRQFHFSWSFRFQQIIFHSCQQSMVSTMRSNV